MEEGGEGGMSAGLLLPLWIRGRERTGRIRRREVRPGMVARCVLSGRKVWSGGRISMCNWWDFWLVMVIILDTIETHGGR